MEKEMFFNKLLEGDITGWFFTEAWSKKDLDSDIY